VHAKPRNTLERVRYVVVIDKAVRREGTLRRVAAVEDRLSKGSGQLQNTHVDCNADPEFRARVY
jgi:hypothetical protein